MLSLMLISILFLILILIFAFISGKSQKNYELQKKLRPAYSVLTVLNCEESVEGIVRSIAWQIQTDSRQPKELVIIDLGSEDRTFYILKRLAIEYPFIHPMYKADYITFVNGL